MNIKRYYFSGIQKIIEHFDKKSIDDSMIFVFHQVSDEKELWLDNACSITQSSFEKLIKECKKKGYEFRKLDDLNGGYKKSVYITFDDIFEDAWENAIRYLIERSIPFTTFISMELVGKKSYITKKQLLELSRESLCTIGYHTKSHKIMRKMNTLEVEKEVDKSDFEKMIGREIHFFAYPYGSIYAVSLKNIKKINQMGYQDAFSTLRMTINDKKLSEFKGFIPRININEKNYMKYL